MFAMRSETICDTLRSATSDRRARRKSMARRSGQSGYVERNGNAYYVRFWMTLPGREKRARKSVRLCSQRSRQDDQTRARKGRLEKRSRIAELIPGNTSNKVEAINLGVTFHKQADWWLDA